MGIVYHEADTPFAGLVSFSKEAANYVASQMSGEIGLPSKGTGSAFL
jgi:hypothetical protein